MRLSIATKIYIAFIGITVMFTGVLMFGIARTQDLYSQIQTLNHRIVPLVLLLSDVQTDLKSFHVVLNERDPLVLRRTLQFTRHIYFLPERFGERLDLIAAMGDHEQMSGLSEFEIYYLRDMHEKLQDLKHNAEAFAARSIEFSDLVLQDKATDATGLASKEVMNFQDALREEARLLDSQLTVLRNDLRTATDLALARANNNERSSLYAMGVLSGLALVIAIGLLIVVLFTVRPLTALTQAARRIGQGDYRPLSNLHQRSLGTDEIALLTREFNAMAASLAERDAQLHQQHAELLQAERLATIGRMTSLITHELRNPLSSINLNSEMLMESLVDHGISPDDAEVLPLLETIIEEVDRLRDITEEYLVYARLPTPKLEHENLSDIVQGLIDFHQWEWTQQEVRIELQVSHEAIPVYADGNQLRQALLNLLKNAIEVSPPGSAVRVVIHTTDDHAHIHVCDHGPGISPSVQARLFEPFFTTKSNGTGLGLPMTQEIIAQHHGTIHVESVPDQGTTFIVELPLASQSNPKEHMQCAS